MSFRMNVVSRTDEEITFFVTFKGAKCFLLQPRATHNRNVEHSIIFFCVIYLLYAINNIDTDRIVLYIRIVER